MVGKIFKIISNSEQFLNEESVAQALLDQITLRDKKPSIFFAVVEHKEKGNSQDNTCVINLDEQCREKRLPGDKKTYHGF